MEHFRDPLMQVTLLRTLTKRFSGWILPFVLITIVTDTPLLVLLVFACIVVLLDLGFLLFFGKSLFIPLVVILISCTLKYRSLADINVIYFDFQNIRNQRIITY